MSTKIYVFFFISKVGNLSKSAFSACVWQFSAILLWRIQDHRSPPVTSLLAVDVATTYHPVRPLRTQHRRWRGIRNWWVLVKTNLATCHGYLYLDSQIMYDPYDIGILKSSKYWKLSCVCIRRNRKFRVPSMTRWFRFRISKSTRNLSEKQRVFIFNERFAFEHVWRSRNAQKVDLEF